MNASPELTATGGGGLDRLLRNRPDIVLMGPYLLYLLLLGVRDLLPYEYRPAAALLRGVGALVLVWLVRKHLPPWGRPCWGVAVLGGLVAAWGWVALHHWFTDLGVPRRLPLPIFPGEAVTVDPRDVVGASSAFRADVFTRIAVAVITVPVVEELFWRAFLLRALIRWDDFEKVPLGAFGWRAFIGTALLSTIQHPDHWAVSIPCWLFFNAVFYWTRSILCLVILHGVTNLALYSYVVAHGDWIFW